MINKQNPHEPVIYGESSRCDQCRSETAMWYEHQTLSYLPFMSF